MSPDSIVPGASSGAGGAGGTVGAWQNSKLTVDFHESKFLSSANGENALTLQKGFWFQLSGQDQSKADPSGPSNPQALSRYSYVLNNPLRYTDPTGHYLIYYTATGVHLFLNAREIKRLLSKAWEGIVAIRETLGQLGAARVPGLGGVIAGALQYALVAAGLSAAQAAAFLAGVAVLIAAKAAEYYLLAQTGGTAEFSLDPAPFFTTREYWGQGGIPDGYNEYYDPATCSSPPPYPGYPGPRPSPAPTVPPNPARTAIPR